MYLPLRVNIHCFAAGRGPGEGAQGEVRGVGGGGGRGRGLHQPRGRERVRAGDRLQAEEQVLLPLTWPHRHTTHGCFAGLRS